MSARAAMTTVRGSAPRAVPARLRGPRLLWADPVAQRPELARFAGYVVAGPSDSDCAIWCGAIGDDGYGRNCVHTNVFRALQVAIHLDGRQAEGLTGPFGHQLTVLEIAHAQFEASSGQSMRPEVATPGCRPVP